MFADELEVLEYQHRVRPIDDTMWDQVATCPVCGLTENCDCENRAVTTTATARYEE